MSLCPSPLYIRAKEGHRAHLQDRDILFPQQLHQDGVEIGSGPVSRAGAGRGCRGLSWGSGRSAPHVVIRPKGRVNLGDRSSCRSWPPLLPARIEAELLRGFLVIPSIDGIKFRGTPRRLGRGSCCSQREAGLNRYEGLGNCANWQSYFRGDHSSCRPWVPLATPNRGRSTLVVFGNAAQRPD